MIELGLAEKIRDQRAGPLLEVDFAGVAREFLGVVLAGSGAGDVQPGRLVGKPQHVAGPRGRPQRQRLVEIGGGGGVARGDKLRVAAFAIDIQGVDAGILGILGIFGTRASAAV